MRLRRAVWQWTGLLLLTVVMVAGLTIRRASSQRLDISPRYPASEWFPAMHIIVVEQLANHAVVIEAVQTAPPGPAGPWQFIAGYGCYPEAQTVIASYPNWDYPWTPAYAFFRSINNPCATGLSRQDNVDPNPVLSPILKSFRLTNGAGVVLRVGPELLPVQTNGVRRFKTVRIDR
jgi:hypothetical protein